MNVTSSKQFITVWNKDFIEFTFKDAGELQCL